MVGPISCVAKLQLNMKPEGDNYTIPKALLELELEEVHMSMYYLEIFYNLFYDLIK